MRRTALGGTPIGQGFRGRDTARGVELASGAGRFMMLSRVDCRGGTAQQGETGRQATRRQWRGPAAPRESEGRGRRSRGVTCFEDA